MPWASERTDTGSKYSGTRSTLERPSIASSRSRQSPSNTEAMVASTARGRRVASNGRRRRFAGSPSVVIIETPPSARSVGEFSTCAGNATGFVQAASTVDQLVTIHVSRQGMYATGDRSRSSA